MKVLQLSPSQGLALLLLLLAVWQLSGCAVSPRLKPSDQPSVAGKTFVITGASSGFGRGVALRLAALQGNVVLAARRTEVLEEVATQARAAGGSALVVTTDVSSPDDIQALARAAIERFGKIDVWINNAAVGALGRFEDVPVEDHARVIDVNLKGVIYGSHAAMRQFRTQGFGTLVNVGSVESEIPLAYHASYAATKGGVMNLGAAIAEEIRLSGSETISVATVMPWAADTPFWKHAANYTGGTPRMATMDGPEQVVEATAWVSVNPRKRLPVGWKARGAVISHSLFPSLTERIAANIAHHWQIEKAPPAPPTTGSLYEPMQSGTTVEGDVRERMEREEAARKQSK
ncbi:short-chain dehydrogenase [Stutzerimonas zhaodongensis]|jgi:short-subunit dehydrogenase|uniref:Short-chain dehydrogenase n=1 Tax=Stutzerimonas zhaodongensis TaxID=1176257 RepID=A0A365PZ63_9GAMM|nr:MULTISPECIES: SDR family NAD(P)-dependent oxidoreductase [Pseudomonadaceae]NKQ12089.1 SDR family NAD(P)-dependent oxidoreductase [Pseudomonas sp. SST3]RBA62244.1 short-chain dehydrogenase [Stutzerimonas zhaodongensis]